MQIVDRRINPKSKSLGNRQRFLRRAKAEPDAARAILMEFADAFGTAATETRTALGATDLVVDHKLQFWDALIVTAAAEAGCTLLLSEDMQHGFVTRGLTIVNPLAGDRHPRVVVVVEELPHQEPSAEGERRRQDRRRHADAAVVVVVVLAHVDLLGVVLRHIDDDRVFEMLVVFQDAKRGMLGKLLGVVCRTLAFEYDTFVGDANHEVTQPTRQA